MNEPQVVEMKLEEWQTIHPGDVVMKDGEPFTVESVVLPQDSVVASVVKKSQERSDVGVKKYGVTLDRTDLSTLDWLTHLQEELMDAVNYIKRLKREL